MPADQLITCDHDPTIRTLPDGTGLCTGDCGQPPVCCPSPCGKKWMLCLNSYSYSAEQVGSRAVVRRVDEFGNITQMPPGDAVRRFESVNLEGGPFQLFGNDIDDGSPCTTGVSRRVPVRWVRLQDSDPNSTGDFRTEDVVCFTAGTFCESGLPIAGNGRPVDVSPSLLGFLNGMGVGTGSLPQLPDIIGAYADTAGQPVVTSSVPASVCRVPGGQGGIPLAAYNVTRSVSRSFVWGPGGCSYDETVVIRQPFKTCTCGVTTSPYQCETREGVIVWTYRKSFRLTWKILEDCDGRTFTPCAGVIPTECTGPVVLVEGAACGRVGPSRVYLPAANVASCGTVAVAAAGGYCYTFKTSGPFRSSLPTGGILGNEIVDQFSPPDCCYCGAASGVCNAADLVGIAAPCWKIGLRTNDNRWIVTPAFVAGLCCCSPNDIITVGAVECHIIRPGIDQIWRVRGGSFSFRRGDTAYLHNWVWDIFDGANPNGPPIAQYSEGDFSNAAPMGCEWTQLGIGGGVSNWFPFAGDFQNGVIVEPVAERNLPCPNDTNGQRGNWWIRRFSPSVTCDSFTFVGDWENVVDGGAFSARFSVGIQRVPSPGDPCAGGCTPADANPLVPSTQTGIAFPPGDIGNLIG